MRNISFALTTQQILDGTKTVTRRIGWRHAKPGDLLQPVRQCMGLRKGQRVEVLRPAIRLVSVRREALSRLVALPDYGRAEVVLEGFADLTPAMFVEFFARSHKCAADVLVTRLEFVYV